MDIALLAGMLGHPSVFVRLKAAPVVLVVASVGVHSWGLPVPLGEEPRSNKAKACHDEPGRVEPAAEEGQEDVEGQPGKSDATAKAAQTSVDGHVVANATEKEIGRVNNENIQQVHCLQL